MLNPLLPLRKSREIITGCLSGEPGIEVPSDRLLYSEHHVCQAVSSFIRSGMKEAPVVVMGFRGEAHSTTIFRGRDERLERLATYNLDPSLGKFRENNI